MITLVKPSPVNRCAWCGQGDHPQAGDVVRFEKGNFTGNYHPRCWEAVRVVSAITAGSSRLTANGQRPTEASHGR